MLKLFEWNFSMEFAFKTFPKNWKKNIQFIHHKITRFHKRENKKTACYIQPQIWKIIWWMVNLIIQ